MSAIIANDHHNLDQRHQALEVANTVRTRISRLRRELRLLPRVEARDQIIALLLDPTPPHDAIRVGWLLCSVHQVGRSHIHRWLIYAGIWSEDRRVRELTPRQRARLADRLREDVR